EHNRCACRGYSHSGAYRSHRPAVVIQSKCWSDHRATRRTARQTDPASVAANEKTALACEAGFCPGNHRGRSLLPAQNRRPTDRPWRSARTIADAIATHYPDRSGDNTPTFAESSANLFPSARQADDVTRTHQAATRRRDDLPTNKRPIAAADATASHQAALAHHIRLLLVEASCRQ